MCSNSDQLSLIQQPPQRLLPWTSSVITGDWISDSKEKGRLKEQMRDSELSIGSAAWRLKWRAKAFPLSVLWWHCGVHAIHPHHYTLCWGWKTIEPSNNGLTSLNHTEKRITLSSLSVDTLGILSWWLKVHQSSRLWTNTSWMDLRNHAFVKDELICPWSHTKLGHKKSKSLKAFIMLCMIKLQAHESVLIAQNCWGIKSSNQSLSFRLNDC